MKKGFTLIEILVVISIIGILTTLIMANLNTARERARDAQRKSDLKSIQTALGLYYNDYEMYPANDSDGRINGCEGETGAGPCDWDGEWSRGETVYMNTLPADPVSTNKYVYSQTDSDHYTLTACLENKSDPKCDKIDGDIVGCSVSGSEIDDGCQYTVKP